MLNSSLFSNNSNEWATPQNFYDELNKIYKFTLDPAANKFNAKCKKFYTIEDDGLSKTWKNEVVFCNPPYGRNIYKWVEKCYNENKNNNTKIILLIPSRTDTKYFHDFIYKKYPIRFIQGRIKFGDSKNSAPFPSLLVLFDSTNKNAFF